MDKRRWDKGSYTIEASVYVPMMMFLVLIALRGGIAFYQQSIAHERYEGLDKIDVVQEFYTYQMIEEVGKEWIDD